MAIKVLISGVSFAGLTLAYWLNKFGYEVTMVELGDCLRKGGSPIDVRGSALETVQQMGIYEKIKAKEFVHTDEIVDKDDKLLAKFSINAMPEYHGDIEIHRGDLVDILFKLVAKEPVKIIFDNSIAKLTQYNDKVGVVFEKGGTGDFDFVFGADGIHSKVRELVFGPENLFKKFFGVYFAFAEASHLRTGRPRNVGVIYRELGKQAVIYPFRERANAVLMFRAPQLDWDYKNHNQHKQILEDYFSNNQHWKIPEILDIMLRTENLYFDEVAQIRMPTWTSGRVALVGDAAHAPSFFTGMGTSLAIQGATLLANELYSNDSHSIAFAKYFANFNPFVKSVQARIDAGLKVQLPETEQELLASIQRWNSLLT